MEGYEIESPHNPHMVSPYSVVQGVGLVWQVHRTAEPTTHLGAYQDGDSDD